MEYLIGIGLGLLLVVGLYFGGKALLKRLLFGAFTGLFDTKSRVLRDATLTVNSISSAPVPPPGPPFDAAELAQWLSPAEVEAERVRHEAAAAADQRRVWYDLDLTITPQPATGPFTLWEPDELRLVGPTVDPRAALRGEDDEADGPAAADVRGVKVWHAGRFTSRHAGKLPGQQRVWLRAGVLPECRELQVVYYADRVGRLRLPEGERET